MPAIASSVPSKKIPHKTTGSAIHWPLATLDNMNRSALEHLLSAPADRHLAPGCPVFIQPRDALRRVKIRRARSVESVAADSARDQPAPEAASRIFAIASSMVKVFGFWIGGKSLKVAAHWPITNCALIRSFSDPEPASAKAKARARLREYTDHDRTRVSRTGREAMSAAVSPPDSAGGTVESGACWAVRRSAFVA